MLACGNGHGRRATSGDVRRTEAISGRKNAADAAEVPTPPRAANRADPHALAIPGGVDHLAVADVDTHVMGTAAEEEDEVAGAGVLELDVAHGPVLRGRVVGKFAANDLAIDVAHESGAVEGVGANGTGPVLVTDLSLGKGHDAGAQVLGAQCLGVRASQDACPRGGRFRVQSDTDRGL